MLLLAVVVDVVDDDDVLVGVVDEGGFGCECGREQTSGVVERVND